MAQKMRINKDNVPVMPTAAAGTPVEWLRPVNTEVTDLQVTGLPGGWVQIEYRGGMRGYVEVANLEPIPVQIPIGGQPTRGTPWYAWALIGGLVLLLAAMVYLAFRPNAATTPYVVKETVVVEQTKIVEKEKAVPQTVIVEKKVVETVVVEQTKVVKETVVVIATNPLPSPTPTFTREPTQAPTQEPAKVPTQGITNMTFGGSDRPANCPTDGSMQELFGFNVRGIKPVFTGENVPWDHCKWTLQAVGVGIFELPLLKDWQFTVTRTDDVVAAYYGDGNTLKVKGATIRYLPAYNTEGTKWVNNGCELLDREDSFGHRRIPTYHTVSGNIPCEGFAHPMVVSGSTNAGTSSNTPGQDQSDPRCPKTPQEAANLLVTDPKDRNASEWKDLGIQPGFNYRKWLFKGTNGRLVNLGYPGFGNYDFWKSTSPVKVPIGQAGEATFNCAKQ